MTGERQVYQSTGQLLTGEGLPVGFHSSATSATNRYWSTFQNYVGGVSLGGLESEGRALPTRI